MQEQQEEINALKNEITSLEQQVAKHDDLNARLSILEGVNAKMDLQEDHQDAVNTLIKKE